MQGWDPDDKANGRGDAHGDDPTPAQDMLLILAFVFFFAIPWLCGVIGIVHWIRGWLA